MPANGDTSKRDLPNRDLPNPQSGNPESAKPDDRNRKPSVLDLVTDPETFDQWQRQREREEAADSRGKPSGRNGDETGRDEDPRDTPSDRRS